MTECGTIVFLLRKLRRHIDHDVVLVQRDGVIVLDPFALIDNRQRDSDSVIEGNNTLGGKNQVFFSVCLSQSKSETLTSAGKSTFAKSPSFAPLINQKTERKVITSFIHFKKKNVIIDVLLDSGSLYVYASDLIRIGMMRIR